MKKGIYRPSQVGSQDAQYVLCLSVSNPACFCFLHLRWDIRQSSQKTHLFEDECIRHNICVRRMVTGTGDTVVLFHSVEPGKWHCRSSWSHTDTLQFHFSIRKFLSDSFDFIIIFGSELKNLVLSVLTSGEPLVKKIGNIYISFQP